MPDATVPAAALVASRLELLSFAALKRVAKTLGLPGASKREHLAEQLAHFLGTPAHLDVLKKRLIPRDWSVLSLLPLRLGPFRQHVLVGALRERGASRADALAQIERLLALGCVLCATQLYNANNRFTIDQDMLRLGGGNFWFDLTPGVGQWAAERNPSKPGLGAVAAPASASESRLAELQRAAFILLAEASRKPIRLTTKGLPYKTEIGRLAGALAGEPTTPARGAKKGSKKRASAEAPPVLWFAFAALIGAHLLRPDEAESAAIADAGTFLTESPAQQVWQLVSGWLNGPFDDLSRVATLTRSYAPDEESIPWIPADAGYYGGPDLDSLARARALIVEVLRLVTTPRPEAWYALDDFARLAYDQNHEMLFRHATDLEFLAERGYDLGPGDGFLPGSRSERQPYFGVRRATDGSPLYLDEDWPEVEGAYVRQVCVESLSWLGLVEVGPAGGAPDRFRLTPLGRHLLLGKPLPAPSDDADDADGRAVVQPNYEVIVLDALANIPLVAQLDAFAERRGLDRAAIFHLRQADLIRGMDHGWTGPRILEVLEQANGGPLPQNVAYTLNEWIAQYERLAIHERATLLEADDAAQLDGWLADAKIAPLLGKRLGPTTALVPAANATALARLLATRKTPVDLVDYAAPASGVLRLQDPDLIELDAANAEPYLAYRLEGFATPAAPDGRTLRYQISRDSIERGAEKGWTGARLVAFLEAASGEGIPIDLYTRLIGWSGALPAPAYEPLVAVSLPSEILDWYTLRELAPIGRLIRGVPSARLALVAPGDLDALRDELAARGLALHPATLPAEALDKETDDELDDYADDDALVDVTEILRRALIGPGAPPGTSKILPLFGGPRRRPPR